MACSNRSTTSTVGRRLALAVLPVFLLAGCADLLGVNDRLAPEDEPYLFDRWDPNFHLAHLCEDVTDERLAELGLSRWEDAHGVIEEDGLNACSLETWEGDLVDLSAAAYKLAMLERKGIPVDYTLLSGDESTLVYQQDETDSFCRVAAETPHGTLEVGFLPSSLKEMPTSEKCAHAEKYFDLLIGEKLDEYRTN
ncbi:hypothetical protein I6J21_05355 [Corynebacterium glucuronolyticum]|uniref:DUF3558 domain-containing protein n=1 Tax=Corynebacterium glucuronolyticum TaxID=39791 RepID=A0AAX1LAR4_9CORY|nr:hypothetical protein I6J21_05355 [Corynebacterium glucuronolyticum]